MARNLPVTAMRQKMSPAEFVGIILIAVVIGAAIGMLRGVVEKYPIYAFGVIVMLAWYVAITSRKL